MSEEERARLESLEGHACTPSTCPYVGRLDAIGQDVREIFGRLGTIDVNLATMATEQKNVKDRLDRAGISVGTWVNILISCATLIVLAASLLKKI